MSLAGAIFLLFLSSALRIGSALPAKCDCSTGNRELLACQPREEFVELKTCDNSGSDKDLVCEYNWRKRPFRVNLSNFIRLSDVKVSAITDTEMAEVTSFFSKVSAAPMLFQSNEFSEREVTVKSYEKLRVFQRMIICEQYVVPTSQRNITRDLQPNMWMRNPATNKLYYFSSDTVARDQAGQHCHAMNASLANLPLDAYRFVAKKALLYDTSLFWWTAAKYRQLTDLKMTSNGEWKTENLFAVGYWPNRPDDLWPTLGQYGTMVYCVAINFAAPPYHFIRGCFTNLGYICEKGNLA